MARKVADFAVRIANRLLKLIRKGPGHLGRPDLPQVPRQRGRRYRLT
jgi:hypothetical protein